MPYNYDRLPGAMQSVRDLLFPPETVTAKTIVEPASKPIAAYSPLVKQKLSANSTTYKAPWPPDEIQDRLDTVSSPAMKEARTVLDEQKRAIAKYMNPSGENQTNIAPILAISDFMTGSEYLKNYKTPEQQRKAQLAELIAAQTDYGKNVHSLGNLENQLIQAQLLATTGSITEGEKEDLAKAGGAAGKPNTAGEMTSAKQAKSMQQQLDILDQLEKEGFNPTTILSLNPLHPKRRAHDGAMASFTETKLRDATGAAAKEAEMKQYRDMLDPKVMDTPTNVAQKRAIMQQDFESKRALAGTAFDRVPTVKVTRTQEAAGNSRADRIKELEAKKAGR